ncbi:hypothetical protein AGMMS50276_03190 [Synergistales bacterium]|nr:hypothetical protein AGMMS50276_03190 [Synergistales bacterium]
MKRKGYVLCLTIVIVFIVSSILGLSVVRVASFSNVASAYLTHGLVRRELISMTNFSVKWLIAKLNAGEVPRTEESAPSDAKNLRVFVQSTERDAQHNGGSVEIFDMGYAHSEAYPSEGKLSLFPPHYPDGYLIRATLAGKGQATLIMENVYIMTSGDAPDSGRFYKLEKTPVYSREIFR